MTAPEPGFAGSGAGAGWRSPRVAPPGFLRYVETIRERRALIAITTVLALLASLLYLATAQKTYEAQSELLVTPISQDDPALTGLALIQASSDPTRDVETVARLVASRDVAVRVKDELKLDETPEQILAKVVASPVAQSNVVAIVARDSDPKLAADIANAFGEQAIADRSEKLRAQLVPLIESLRSRISKGDETTGNGTLSDQLARLENLQTSGDPTIRLETRAAEPDSPVAPRPMLTILAGLFGGLVLGVGAAFVLQAIDLRLRREEQLRELYGLPVLARIPRERHAGNGPPRQVRRNKAYHERRRPLGPSALSPRTLEAYRTLRTMLSAVVADGADEQEGLGRAVLITGPSPAEGKTTTAINLASSYALAGKRVIVLEADFRRPSIAKALHVKPRNEIGKVLMGEASLEDGLVSVKPFGSELRLLPVDRPDDHLSELLSLPVASKLLDEARRLADYVIIDSPPLTEVVDALPLARYADDVLVVCRLGMSSMQQLSRLADLLEQNAIEPRGFVVVGVGSAEEESYYLDGRRERGPELGGPNGEPAVASKPGRAGNKPRNAGKQSGSASRGGRGRPLGKR